MTMTPLTTNTVRRRSAMPVDRGERDRETELQERAAQLDQRERDLGDRERANIVDTARALGRDVRHDQMVRDPAAVAAAIIRAGRIRRGEIDDTPEPTGIAAQVVAAARKRRGEIV